MLFVILPLERSLATTHPTSITVRYEKECYYILLGMLTCVDLRHRKITVHHHELTSSHTRFPRLLYALSDFRFDNILIHSTNKQLHS
jgi:hypothetical protein